MTYAERVRLVTLAPKWWNETPDRSGMGLSFVCPHCHDTRLAVAFGNPLDGGAPTKLSKFLWQRSGDDFETLTVRPSIDCTAIGHWHGLISDGLVHPL